LMATHASVAKQETAASPPPDTGINGLALRSPGPGIPDQLRPFQR
jgi:hypothetical protein